MVSNEELTEYFEASVETYRFLSQMLFKELTQEAIDRLAASEWPRDTGDPLLDEGYRLLRRYFKFAATDPRTQLAVEYARIFLAAGVYAPDTRSAVPYESVFTGEEHLVMGEARDDVVKRFREDGFEVNPALHEPEDHLSFEFEYLAHMSSRALESLGAGDTAALHRNMRRQVEFIDRHLLNWVPELTEVVREYAKTTFYTGMLTVARGALQQSRDFLQDALDGMDGAGEGRDGAAAEPAAPGTAPVAAAPAGE